MAGEKVLVVDDGADICAFIVEHVLQPIGYTSVVARDGREALRVMTEQKPDLVILDYQMPRMNGLEVLQALQARGPNVPVILMTMHGSEDFAVEVYRLGVRDYVRKPFGVEELTGAIERCMAEVRLRREKEALTERLLRANYELQRRVQELQVLVQAGKQMASASNRAALLPSVVEAASALVDAEEVRLYLLDDGALTCVAHQRRGSTRAEAANVLLKDPIALYVIRTGEARLLGKQDMGNRADGPQAALYAPLILHGRALGVLGAVNYAQRSQTFGAHQVQLLSALADFTAVALAQTTLPQPHTRPQPPAN